MPTYDYRCEGGHVFEVFHGIKDESPRSCPECGRPSTRVPSGGSGLLFRGSGFHVTDYRSSSYKERAKSEKPGSATSGESSKPDSGAGKAKPGGSSGPPSP